MTKTTQIAADRAHDQTKTIMPAEIARGVYIEHPPGAQALKLMHLMIAVAGGRMAEDVTHQIRGRDIRAIEGMRKHDRASLVPLFAEIRATTIISDDTAAKKVRIGGFLDTADVDYSNGDDGDLIIRWWFSRSFRDTAAASTHWAIIDRQTVFALRSKFTIHLFQRISSLANLDHKTSETVSLEHLRAMLGIGEGKLVRWDMTNRKALAPAIAEINALSRFNVTATPIKEGRSVASVRIAWEPKPDPRAVKAELDRSKIGRKPRIAGTVEAVAPAGPPIFPDPGTALSHAQPWAAIREAAGITGAEAGRRLSNAFHADLEVKRMARDDPRVFEMFAAFCANWLAEQ